ncbi:unnamed protein product, partial [Amoebophrya sp. A25]
YQAISEDEKCAEAIALSTEFESPGGQELCDEIGKYFTRENPDTIPLLDGDTRGESLIRDKLKKQPKTVSR